MQSYLHDLYELTNKLEQRDIQRQRDIEHLYELHNKLAQRDIHELYQLYNKLAKWSKETSKYINNHEVRLQNLQNLSSRQNSVFRPITSVRQNLSSNSSSPRNSPPRIISPKRGGKFVSPRGGKSSKKRTKKRKTRNRKKIK